MSCPDPLHDYEDWTDENGKEWKVGYDNNENERIPVDHGIIGSDSIVIVPEKKPTMVDFYQHQYKRAIWRARVRRHSRG